MGSVDLCFGESYEKLATEAEGNAGLESRDGSKSKNTEGGSRVVVASGVGVREEDLGVDLAVDLRAERKSELKLVTLDLGI